MLTFEKLFLVAPMIPVIVVVMVLISLSVGHMFIKKQLSSTLEEVHRLKEDLAELRRASHATQGSSITEGQELEATDEK
jgi:hypothetical protein